MVGIDIDEDVLAIAKGNAKLNNVRHVKFVQADIFPWLRDAGNRGDLFDVVILDPAKMTRDREQVIPALKKYLDMNKLALGVVKPGGLLATFSCTGLVSEDEFLGMLRRAAFYAGRTVQVLKVSGAGADHPFRRRRAGVALPQGGVLPGAGLRFAASTACVNATARRSACRCAG